MKGALALWLGLSCSAQIVSCSTSDHALPQTVTVYAWPLAAPSPTPLVEIRYDPTTLRTAVDGYRAPPKLGDVDGMTAEDDDRRLTRVGLYEPKTKRWSGVVTDVAAFTATHTPTVTLHLDEQGKAEHLGFQPSRPSAAQAVGDDDDARVRVRLLRPTPGPTPHVNKPVLVDADGKAPQQEPEKTLLQKYWWLLLGIILLAVTSGGGDK